MKLLKQAEYMAATGFTLHPTIAFRSGLGPYKAQAVGRNILEIAYHLLSEQTTYRELGIDYFDRYRAERLKRRSLAQLQRLGYQVTLVPLPTAA